MKTNGGFPLNVETFALGKTGTFQLSVATGLQKRVAEHHRLPANLHHVLPAEQPIQHLFDLVNRYTKRHVERELEFFQRFPQAYDTEEIIDKLEDIKQKTTQQTRSCILRLAFGSGFHGMTGDWRFSDHLSTIDQPDEKNLVYNPRVRAKEPARYKSRRLAYNGEVFAPMGFLRLTLPESAESITLVQRGG